MDMEENQDRMWARALHKTLKKHDLEIESEELRNKAHEYSQRMLDMPLTRILKEDDGASEDD